NAKLFSVNRAAIAFLSPKLVHLPASKQAIKPRAELNSAVSDDLVEEIKFSGRRGHFEVFDARMALFDAARRYDIRTLFVMEFLRKMLCRLRLYASFLSARATCSIYSMFNIFIQYVARRAVCNELWDLILDYLLPLFTLRGCV
ncbi:hypothetical protein CORC01_07380, partial [Colletotrichum orchidophilum]